MSRKVYKMSPGSNHAGSWHRHCKEMPIGLTTSTSYLAAKYFEHTLVNQSLA